MFDSLRDYVRTVCHRALFWATGSPGCEVHSLAILKLALFGRTAIAADGGHFSRAVLLTFWLYLIFFLVEVMRQLGEEIPVGPI